MAYSEKPWNPQVSDYGDAAAYCSACLVDNNGSGKKEVGQCHFPYKEPGGAINVNALRAIIGGRGAQASFPGAQAARAKARSMFESYKSSQGGSSRSEEDPVDEEFDGEETELGLGDQVSFCRAVYEAGEEPVWKTRDDGGSLPTLVGKFASYDNWNEIRSRSEAREMGLTGDRYMERVLPGAFRKTLQERAGQIKVLFNHGTDPSIGKKPLGEIVSVTERDDGPQYEVKLFDTSYVRDLIPALRANQFGSSYRSDLVKGRLRKRAKRSEYNPDGIPEATVAEIRLKEIGPVTFPAEQRATAGVRSITDWVRSEDLALALRQWVHEEAIEGYDADATEREIEEVTEEIEHEDLEQEELDTERSEYDDDAATLDEEEQPESGIEPVRATAVYLGSSRRTRRQRTNYLTQEGVRPKWHL